MWLKTLGRAFKAVGRAIYKVFSSPEALGAYNIIISIILPEAKPVVESIRKIVASPTQATVPEIIDLYRQFGRTITAVADNPKSKANDLLNLATDILQEKFPELDTPLIESAVTMALGMLKAEGK